MQPRLYMEDDLAAGAAPVLGPERVHYLRHVLRLGAGADLRLFNGRDGEWRARIAALGKRSATLDVEVRTRPQAPLPDLWLLFAPIKRTHIDLVAAKATELGAGALLPIVTERTAMTRVGVDRLRAIAIESAEQCRCLGVPRIEEPQALGAVIDRWPAGRRLVLCAETGAAEPIAVALSRLPRGKPGAILVGPEGGFATAELDRLRDLPFVTAVGLGPRLLRAETAAIAALACWQAIMGDGMERPPEISA